MGKGKKKKKSSSKEFSQMDVTAPLDKMTASKKITNDIVGYLIQLSNFADMNEEDIYEQLFIWEAEAGGSIDRISTMVGNAYKGFTIDSVDGKLEETEKSTILKANAMGRKMRIKNMLESIAEIGMMHGNVYLVENDDLSLSILPNRNVTLLDKRDRKITDGTEIMEVNYLILNEGDSQNEKVYEKEKFYHIKYKDTPIHVKDNKTRMTFGVYSPSPLHRAVIPIWWKRQTEIIDILWRWRNVPREHHSIDAEMFSLEKYTGDLASRRAQSKTDATTFVNEYMTMIKDRVPDQGYATLSTVGIEMLEPKSSGYMNTNELIEQLSKNVWTSLNIPSSIVNGESTSSYASELMLSNYVTDKIVSFAEKIADVLTENVKKRLRRVQSSLPVENLEMKLELIMASTKLEIFRQAAIMAGMGVYTDTEIRAETGYDQLLESQMNRVVNNAIGVVKLNTNAGTGEPNSPETPQSRSQHPTDPGTRMANRPRTQNNNQMRGVL